MEDEEAEDEEVEEEDTLEENEEGRETEDSEDSEEEEETEEVEESEGKSPDVEETGEEPTVIFTIKTVVGRENIVADSIAIKVGSENLKIKSLVHPEEIRGYLFIEGTQEDIEKVVKMVPHVRGLIKRPVEIKDIQRFLQPRKVEVDLKNGDVVEVIGGPFKGEKGKVTRYDKVKREVTIELIDVAVPIPVTVSVEFVKLLKRSK